MKYEIGEAGAEPERRFAFPFGRDVRREPAAGNNATQFNTPRHHSTVDSRQKTHEASDRAQGPAFPFVLHKYILQSAVAT